MPWVGLDSLVRIIIIFRLQGRNPSVSVGMSILTQFFFLFLPFLSFLLIFLKVLDQVLRD